MEKEPGFIRSLRGTRFSLAEYGFILIGANLVISYLSKFIGATSGSSDIPLISSITPFAILQEIFVIFVVGSLFVIVYVFIFFRYVNLGIPTIGPEIFNELCLYNNFLIIRYNIHYTSFEYLRIKYSDILRIKHKPDAFLKFLKASDIILELKGGKEFKLCGFDDGEWLSKFLHSKVK